MIGARRFVELLRLALLLVLFWCAIAIWGYNGRIVALFVSTQPNIELLPAPIHIGLILATFSPLIFAVVQRAPIAAPHRARNFVRMILALAAVAFVHGLLMAAIWVGFAADMRAEFWRRVLVNMRSGAVLYGLAVLLSHVVLARLQAAERERRRAELEGLLTRTQTEALRGRLSPTFLFGALDEIIATIHSDRDEAERLLVTLSQLLRGVMDLDRESVIPLADELDLIDHYVELQRESMALVIDVDGETRDRAVPPFVLQSFVAAMLAEGKDALTIRGGGAGALTITTDARGNAIDAARRIAAQIERLFRGQYGARVSCDGASLVGEVRL